MIKKDYILRLIEQIALVIARILKLKLAGNHTAALALLEQTVQYYFGMTLDFIERLPVEELLLLLRVGDDLDAQRCVLLAELLKAEGEVKAAQNLPDDAVRCYTKALHLFLSGSVDHPELLSEQRRAKLDELMILLEEFRLPPELSMLTVRWLCAAGRFDKAEDALYQLLEDYGRTAETSAFARSIYEGLLEKTDEELIAGGLPRAEVKEGLRSVGGTGR